MESSKDEVHGLRLAEIWGVALLQQQPSIFTCLFFLNMWKIVGMQTMKSPRIDLQSIKGALESPDATYLMLDDGSRIAGHNLKQGWRLLAVETPDKLNYDVSVEDANSKMSFRIARDNFHDFVTTRLQ